MNPGRYRSSLNLSIYLPVSKRNGKKTNSNKIYKDKIKLEIKSKI